MSVQDQVLAAMLTRDWSKESAHYVVTRAFEDDPAFCSYLIKQFLLKKAKPPTKPKPKIPASLRWDVFERDGFKCRYCGSNHRLHADHVVAQSKGGPTTFDNLQTLCGSCNSTKGSR